MLYLEHYFNKQRALKIMAQITQDFPTYNFEYNNGWICGSTKDGSVLSIIEKGSFQERIMWHEQFIK